MNDITSKAELIQTCNLAYQYILDTAVEGQQGTRLTHAQCADLGRRLSQIWHATPDVSPDVAPAAAIVPIDKRIGTVSREWLLNKAERIVDELTSMKSDCPDDDTKPADRIVFMRKTGHGELNLGGSSRKNMIHELTNELTLMLSLLSIGVLENCPTK